MGERLRKLFMKLRRKKKKTEIMERRIFQFFVLSLIVTFNLVVVLKVDKTSAYFNDNEDSPGNTYSAGVLDFSLYSVSDFSPQVGPGQNSTRQVDLINNGIFDFKYNIKVASTSGDLCPYLDLENEGGGFQSLNSFISLEDVFSLNPEQFFTAQLTSIDGALQNKSCDFDLVFDGWQTNLPDNSSGFTDKEKISSHIESGSWMPLVDITYPVGGEYWYLVPPECPSISVCSQWCQNHGMNDQCQYEITWNAQNQVGPDDDLLIDLYYSNNSGQTWFATLATSTENDGSFLWKPPYENAYLTYQARIKVVATHNTYSSLWGEDESNDFCPPLLSLDDITNWENAVKWLGTEEEKAEYREKERREREKEKMKENPFFPQIAEMQATSSATSTITSTVEVPQIAGTSTVSTSTEVSTTTKEASTTEEMEILEPTSTISVNASSTEKITTSTPDATSTPEVLEEELVVEQEADEEENSTEEIPVLEEPVQIPQQTEPQKEDETKNEDEDNEDESEI